MSNPLYFGLVGAAAAGVILLALVYPQGQGARSPAPFGHALAPLKAAAKPPSAPPRAAPLPPTALRRAAAPPTVPAGSAAP